MSHERSTPPSPTSGHIPSPSPDISTGSAGYALDSTGITPLEKFAMGRSDTTFNAIAGAAGGFTSGVVTCPLDVIKTKLQAQGGFRAAGATAQLQPTVARYNGMLGTARVIWMEEGLKGMYRGLGPIILGYLPTWAVWFTIYGKTKTYLATKTDNAVLANFGSSIIAGASSTMVTNPIWVIKTRLMSQVSRRSTSTSARPPWHYKSTLDAARKMYATEGILSFYSGLTPALLGLTHVAVQFPAYEYLRVKFTGQGMGTQAEGDDKSHWFGILSASVLSKVLASSATYPHEVLRTRLQTQQRTMPSSSKDFGTPRGGPEKSTHQKAVSNTVAEAVAALPRYRGMVTTFKAILREEGWRAFYAGMGTNMMRAVPAATTTMLTYEYIIKQLHHAKDEGSRKSVYL